MSGQLDRRPPLNHCRAGTPLDHVDHIYPLRSRCSRGTLTEASALRARALIHGSTMAGRDSHATACFPRRVGVHSVKGVSTRPPGGADRADPDDERQRRQRCSTRSPPNANHDGSEQFVRALALDWGRRGVRDNAVAPSLIKTDLVAALTSDPQVVAKFEDRTALGRIGEAEDVAPVVLFLACGSTSYLRSAGSRWLGSLRSRCRHS